MCIFSGLVHLCLTLLELQELALQSLHLLLQAFGSRHGLINLCSDCLKIVCQFFLLLFCLCHLCITICFLFSFLLGFFQQLRNHILNEAFDFCEWIITTATIIPHCCLNTRSQLGKCWGVLRPCKPTNHGSCLYATLACPGMQLGV